MQVRSQISMVFHLDKCIGCHTCSVAGKNVWTDRKGAEYMWWNNVETKPGTGYPTPWENQDKYQGGWKNNGNGKLDIRSTSKTKVVPNIFHNPHMPSMDDYYEPWTYDYQNLFNAPEGSDQPTPEPISMIDGEKIDVQAGPNWDDDLGGSPIYAANDPNLAGLTEQMNGVLITELSNPFAIDASDRLSLPDAAEDPADATSQEREASAQQRLRASIDSHAGGDDRGLYPAAKAGDLLGRSFAQSRQAAVRV